jgi:hypothetical protein
LHDTLLFRPGALYFMKTALDAMQHTTALPTVEKSLQKELLLALERARTRLAIAIASEKKSTLPGRWQYYLDTADRMRRLIRKLRGTDLRSFRRDECASALQAMRNIPAQDGALHLCETIGRVLSAME